jgi:hypothetical protein
MTLARVEVGENTKNVMVDNKTSYPTTRTSEKPEINELTLTFTGINIVILKNGKSLYILR